MQNSSTDIAKPSTEDRERPNQTEMPGKINKP